LDGKPVKNTHTYSPVVQQARQHPSLYAFHDRHANHLKYKAKSKGKRNNDLKEAQSYIINWV
jgi:hypothetical protein